jgi:hypothetical protein
MAAGILSACSKSSFLDKKSDTRLVVPTTLTDFQALLDNQYVMQETPELGELSSDDYYITFNSWISFKSAKSQNAYIWAKDVYDGQNLIPDWDDPYQQVFYANVVLDGLKNIIPNATNRQQWDTVSGTAYFIRAYAFYNLSQVFAPVYNPSTASTDLGIPLRIIPDVNVKYPRAYVQDTYNQILSDLKKADSLLPVAVPINNLNRPSRPAALALIARVYLSMRIYDSAYTYANSCLQLYDSLMVYKDLNTASVLPISQSNPETLYQSVLLSTSEVLGGILKTTCIVDSNLYASYRPGDLRKQVFYKQNGNMATLKGSYNGHSFCFSGLAVDEVYLIRAECAAIAGNKDAALADLNHLLQHRWDSTFVPVTAATATDARDSILVERRKELAFRGVRWSDLRRLNKEGANDTLNRVLNGRTYRLSPLSPNYVLPIPPDVIDISGMPNNLRVDINPN